MPEPQVTVALAGRFAEFVEQCVEYEEAATPTALLEKLLLEEAKRRKEALEDDLEAALQGPFIKMTFEELASEEAWDILMNRKSLPAEQSAA